jgi:hypothetical protein
VFGPMRENDAKDSSEPTTTMNPPAPKLTQVLSKKLLTWGVEARGAYLYLGLETRSLIRMRGGSISRTPSVHMHRHSPCPPQGKDGNAFHENFLYMAFREHEHLVVRPLFPRLALVSRTPWCGSIRRFSAGTLGPVAFGLSLRDSCLVIMLFTLLAAIAPSYL